MMYRDITCNCKALMRPRWTRDDKPRAFICTRCGRSVPGYERLFWDREKALQKEQEG